jgi:hypothetical protein
VGAQKNGRANEAHEEGLKSPASEEVGGEDNEGKNSTEGEERKTRATARDYTWHRGPFGWRKLGHQGSWIILD